MYGVERRRWIVDHTRATGRVDVAQVAEELDVAKETVRRDLRVLELEGLLRRVHGGAVPVERLGFEGALAERQGARQEIKARIAERALQFLEGAESVYIDEGSTGQAVADRLYPTRPLTVITNALPVALILAPRENIQVIMIGGRVRGAALGTVDHWAVRMLDDFVFDVSFMGTNGITMERGLTCPNAAVAAVKERAIAVSRRVVLVADGSKFGVDSSYRFARTRDLNVVVTDRSAGELLVRKLRSHSVEAVVV